MFLFLLFNIENPMHDDKVNIETKLNILNKSFNVNKNGDIECSIDMEVSTGFSQNTSMYIIENIEIHELSRETNDYDSLIIYIVQNGDTLWKIAKKFRSTVQDLAKMNEIEENDEIQVGQKIYIPKFKNIGRKENLDAVSA